MRRALERRRLRVVREDSADAFVRSRGPLRRVLAALCERFVAARGWEPLGFVRVGDWAREWSARQLARRTAGEALPVWEAMEAIAAEVLSAFPLEVDPGIVGSIAPAPVETRSAAIVCAAQGPADEPLDLPPAILPRFLAPLVEGFDEADAFELDARLRQAVGLEQRVEAELGEHLLGVRDVERYAQERLGISPRKARGILRLARAARQFPQLAEAWRAGRISWAKAQTVLNALAAQPDRAVEWLALAESATLRQLEDDVDRQLCAEPTGGGATEEEDCEPFWVGPADSIRLFRATLCTIRRRIERATGHIPSEGGAFEAMLDHVILVWRGDERGVFSRDRWRCTVPGCTSYRNLHAHHIQPRSAGGSDDESNLTTLCAKHHLRLVHGGLMRISGRAPDALRFALATAPA